MDENTEKGRLELKGYDAAYKFSKDIFKDYPKIIKTLILFGSYSKGKQTESSDVDIMIIMDDLLNNLDEKFLGPFYADVDKLVKLEKSVKFHMNFVTLTAFWRGVIAADPVSVNVLKYGVPLIDTGFFEPLQALLQKGEIKPTEESIYASLTRSEILANSAKARFNGTLLDLYWSVVNSAQAVIMRNGEVPPSPEIIGGLLESLSRMSVISTEDAKTFSEIYSLGKKIMHNEKLELSGEKIEQLISKTLEFNEKMYSLASNK